MNNSAARAIIHHSRCRNRKSDFLAGYAHLANWIASWLMPAFWSTRLNNKLLRPTHKHGCVFHPLICVVQSKGRASEILTWTLIKDFSLEPARDAATQNFCVFFSRGRVNKFYFTLFQACVGCWDSESPPSWSAASPSSSRHLRFSWTRWEINPNDGDLVIIIGEINQPFVTTKVAN